DEPAVRHRVLREPPPEQRPETPPADDDQPNENRQSAQPNLLAALGRDPCRGAGDRRPDHKDDRRPDDLLPVRPQLHHDLLVAAQQPSGISHHPSLHPRWGIVTARYASRQDPEPRYRWGNQQESAAQPARTNRTTGRG